MKICAVTVTYGNRFKYLKQVIDSVLNEGVCKVIVVDNASEEESRNKLKNLEEKLKDKIKVIYLPENTGSAGGFKRGLKEAYNDKDCEFILLLDDDNVLVEGSLQNLINYWNKLDIKLKKDKVALCTVRRESISIENINVFSKPPIKNSINGFHFFNPLKKLIKNIGEIPKLNQEKVKIPMSAYGGMFFNKKLLKTIGFPNESFYLYVDDCEFSYRITSKGGTIFLVPNSIIKDLLGNWFERKGLFYIRPIDSSDKIRTYYNIRNNVYFSKKYLVDNFFVFYFNVVVYAFLLTVIGILKGKPKRSLLIIKAIIDGLKSNMGKTI